MPDQDVKVKRLDPQIPRGSIARAYGGAIGTVGVGFAILEIFRDDPHGSVKLFAEFGPKYILFGFLAFVGWDLLKRALRMLSRGVEHVGAMADNTGKLASSVNDLAGKSDRTADEMRRLCSFSAQQSERAVEIAQENKAYAEEAKESAKAAHEVTLETNVLIKQLVAKGVAQ